MGNWDSYKHEERVSLTPGDYWVEIVSAEEKMSKANNPMIVVGVKPNGSNIVINDYFVSGEYFNRQISGFFDAFPQIDDGDFNFLSWIGCVGVARLKQDGDYLRVHYYLRPEQTDNLPPWKGDYPERQTVTELQETTEFDDEDLPWA